jgi:hypothetical protein
MWRAVLRVLLIDLLADITRVRDSARMPPWRVTI